jgi:hypothetical protein
MPDDLYILNMAHNQYPGEDLVQAGLEDLARGVRSTPALLVSIGAPRLRKLGHSIPNPIAMPERALYDHLCEADSATAHSRYNALVRRLVSYERAVECAT